MAASRGQTDAYHWGREIREGILDQWHCAFLGETKSASLLTLSRCEPVSLKPPCLLANTFWSFCFVLFFFATICKNSVISSWPMYANLIMLHKSLHFLKSVYHISGIMSGDLFFYPLNNLIFCLFLNILRTFYNI